MEKKEQLSLENHEKRIKKLEEIIFGSREEISFKPSNMDEKIKTLAKDSGLSAEEINNVFLIDSNGVNLIALIEGKNEGEKQLKATLSLLTAYSYLFGTDEIETSVLKQKLKKLGIKSLVNVSTNLSKFSRFVYQVGDMGSTKYKYKLTIPGKNEGLKLIHNFAKKTNGDKNQ